MPGRIGTPTFGVSLMLLAISSALLFFIVYAGISMNNAARNSQRDLISAALSDAVNRTLMEQKGIALWDESTRAAQGKIFNVNWFDEEVGAYFTEGYGHDQVYILDPSDRVIYGYAHGKHLDAAQFEEIRSKVGPMIAEVRSAKKRTYLERDRLFGLNQQRYSRLQGARSARWAANILSGPEGPVIVSIMTIVPTVDTSLLLPRPYLMVSVVKIDQAMMDLIGRSIKIGAIRLDPANVTDSQAVPLVSDEGEVAAMMSWTSPKPGQLLLTRILPIFAVLLIVAAFYTMMIFRRLNEAYAKLRDQEASARFMAMHDGLSQLPNRRNFIQTLRTRLSLLARENSSNRIAIAYVDVDRFKDVNDAIGHGAGDSLIIQIGPRLKDLLRPRDMLARLGGDEFAVMREIVPGEDPAKLGETIMAAFKRPFDVGNQQIEVTASVGIAVAASGEADPDRVVQDADISLYRAKDLGRNRYALFEASMAEEVRSRHEIETDLRAAIGTSQIQMYYQPVISVRTGQVTSVEALVRWKHPKKGLIEPGRFISLAEQGGLMVPLGDHILEQVFREAHRFANVDIAINLSPVQLRQRHLPDRLDQLARLFSVDPRRIVLEVTESMLIDADGATERSFEDIRKLGFRMALDDFGTGYSSLGYLHRFEFSKIKIDRSFVSSGSLERLRPIIEAIVHIGRGLRMDIVAEGVESAAELAMIQALGCTEAQGYWISRPLPLEDILAFISTPRSGGPKRQPLQVARG
ncbi:bifunctional diguanylate cyclase/phosphodiesterase [Flavisphingomonas formosensis]|uniref:bifunctional diguanylate cyclase/phosphodiesterase n=1 Tax=Flavisphingomonas formosensis TaxID=861534 RepID=UPI0018DF754E|nr:EAL domain-containing protein [Sphingomonas formosensis]